MEADARATIPTEAISREKDTLKILGNAYEEERLDVKMLRHNQIPGMLPFQVQYIDDVSQYCFVLSGKISLEDFLSCNRLSMKHVCRLCEDICACSKVCREYFLQEEHFLMQLPYIFWDAREERFWLCYCPAWTQDFENQIKTLWEALLPAIDHREKDAVSFGYGVYHVVSAEGFHIAELERYRKLHAQEHMEKPSEKEQEKPPQISKKKRPDTEDDAREEGAQSTIGRREKTNAIGYLKNSSPYPMVPMQIPLDRDMLTIGRAPDNDVVLLGGQISWQHARIEVEGAQVFVTDVGAANGVFVNRRRLIRKHPVQCRRGDEIAFADITYVLEDFPK